MEFSFTSDQRMFSDSIDRFLRDRYDLPSRRRLMNDSAGEDRLWRELAELGWIGAAFPEEFGGFSTSALDMLAVMDRLGRHLVTLPYLVTAVVCGSILMEGSAQTGRDALIGQIIAGDLQLALAAGSSHMLRSPEHTTFAATKNGRGFVLNGRMPVVLNGARADKIIVAARTAGAFGEQDGVTLFLVDAEAEAVSRRGFRLIDGHGASEIVIDGLAVDVDQVLGPIDGGVSLVVRALDRGTVGVCGEAIGSMTHLVAATSTYTKGREQYGQPLAKFQVLQHRMADMYIQTETARSMAFMASHALDAPDISRARAISAAKAQVGRSARFVGYHAVQLHGGMGMSEELDIGHHYIRLTTTNELFGDQAFHLKRFAEMDDLESSTAIA